MTCEKEIILKNWEGKIPVLFCLYEKDQFTHEDCEPMFLSVRRQTYFPILLHEKLDKYFRKFLKPDCSLVDFWLEDQTGRLLKWHWPVGVLFDIACLSEVFIFYFYLLNLIGIP